jgi:hypothetical protein
VYSDRFCSIRSQHAPAPCPDSEATQRGLRGWDAFQTERPCGGNLANRQHQSIRQAAEVILDLPCHPAMTECRHLSDSSQCHVRRRATKSTHRIMGNYKSLIDIWVEYCSKAMDTRNSADVVRLYYIAKGLSYLPVSSQCPS